MLKRPEPFAARKPDPDAADPLAAGEAARSAAEPPPLVKTEEKKEESLSLFWRVFGGTIISMVALGVLTLYNNLSSNISELRKELNTERELRADLVKKDEFNARTASQAEQIRAVENLKLDIEALRERAGTNATAIEALKRDATAGLDALRKDLAAVADTVKKDTAALDLLKERTQALEGLKKDVAGIDVVRERLTMATTELKAIRDEVAKIQQELERNKAADLERKLARDAQYRQTEELLKELQKGLQDCREKLARLEALQAAARATGPEAAPPRPSDKKD